MAKEKLGSGISFFEKHLTLFGLNFEAALVTVVGVLVEVPVMLTLVRIANNTRAWFSTDK